MNKSFFEVAGTSQNINEFIQKLPLPVAAINREKEIVAYNRAFFLLAGREIRQGIHHCYEFLNFPFCHTNCLADMSAKMRKTVNWDESRGHRKNGEELIVRPIVFPLFGADEEVEGHLLLFLDTTDEVQLYQNFRSNLDHLERKVAFLQTLNEVADQFRKITQVDLLIEQIVNFTIHHLSADCAQIVQPKKGKKGFQAIHTASTDPYPLTPDQAQQLIRELIPGFHSLIQQPERYVVHHFEDPSAQIYERREVVLLPIRSGSSDHGYLVIHRFSKDSPISAERLEYWELFAKSIGPYIENCHIISNLEIIVTDRTRELQSAQAQLMESTRLASVGEMAGMVAHEVLNPMTAILARVRHLQKEEGSLALLKEIFGAWQTDFDQGGIPQLVQGFQTITTLGQSLLEEDLGNVSESVESLRTDLQFLDEHLNRIVRIVDNLRGLSRSQNISHSVDLKEILDKTAKLMDDDLRKRSIELILKTQHESKVTCDSNELIQVFHNLFRNAMQAIVKEGKIEVSTVETVDRVEIRVQDSGSGIPAAVVPRIFEMRFTTKSAHEGTGMGLNLSRRLMRQVLGDLELESPGGSGVGAVFLCWIPKVKATSSLPNE